MNLQENIERIKQVMGLSENRIDRILDKINEKGIKSLTPQEKRILQGKEDEESGLTKDDCRYQIFVDYNDNSVSPTHIEKKIKGILHKEGIDTVVNQEVIFPDMYYVVYYVHEFESGKIIDILTQNGYSIYGEPTEVKKYDPEKSDREREETIRQNATLILFPHHEYKQSGSGEISRINDIISSLGIYNHGVLADKDGTFLVDVRPYSKDLMDKLIGKFEGYGYDVSII